MTTFDIGKQLVDLCNAGKNAEAMEQLYASDILSVEAAAPPGSAAESHGLAACLKKSAHWREANEIHGKTIEGPFPHGDRFAVIFRYDLTQRASGKRFKLEEVALYTVKGDKIVREEFFYAM